MEYEDGDSFEAIGRLVAELREARGLTSQSALAREIHVCAPVVNKVERGVTLSEQTAELLDAYFETGGAISARRRRVKASQPGLDGVPEKGDTTDRRQFVEIGALSALAVTDEREIHAGGPDGATLDEIEADADDIAVAYGSAPRAELLPVVVARWQELRGMLRGYLSPAVRPRVVLLRGQFSYFLGRMAFNADDMRSARRFARLAGRYAEESGEPVLILSVAALRSSIAYWRNRYGPAIDILRAVQHVTHPYMDARIAAYEARILVKLGDHDGARAALDRMEAKAGTFTPMPGSTPVGPAGVAMFRAGVALANGDDAAAREWAPLAVAGYGHRGGDYSVEEAQHAALTLALVHLVGSQPEPEEAARLACAVLTDPTAITHTVTARARQVGRTFRPEHRSLPEVAAFTEAYRSLPAGTGAQ